MKTVLGLFEDVSCSIQGGDARISAIAYDSRQAVPGTLFFAYKGQRFDGRDFIEDACARGATAICTDADMDAVPAGAETLIRVNNIRTVLARVAARFYDYPSRALKLIGITGTNGKTTTAFFLRALLAGAGFSTGMIGTIHTVVAGTPRPAGLTTPENSDIQGLLREMVDGGDVFAVAEISSQGLDRGRADGLEFSQCLFTNLSGEHLDYHGDMENYFQAKTTLFARRAPGVPGIINLDDEYGRRIAADFPDIHGVSLDRDAWLRGTVKEARMQTTELELCWEGQKVGLTLNRAGRHNAQNFLLAAAAGLKAGLTFDQIVLAAGRLPVVPGRLEPVDCGQAFQVYVDYAHTDNALQNVLAALRTITSGRIITVFGAGGDRDRSKRPRMGAAACAGSDLVIITSDNPRTEDPQAIIEDILEGTGGRQWQVETDRRTAICLALQEAADGDSVLIAGKGHEDYQIIGTQKRHFSDAEIVSECLCGKAVS